MQEHEDGYCDRCGCETDAPQLTVDGRELCPQCAGVHVAGTVDAETAPGAYDRG